MAKGIRVNIAESEKKGGRLESLLVKTTQFTQRAGVELDLQDQETLSMVLPELLRQARLQAEQILFEDALIEGKERK